MSVRLDFPKSVTSQTPRIVPSNLSRVASLVVQLQRIVGHGSPYEVGISSFFGARGVLTLTIQKYSTSVLNTHWLSVQQLDSATTACRRFLPTYQNLLCIFDTSSLGISRNNLRLTYAGCIDGKCLTTL